MSSNTELSNLAISNLGIGKTISDFESEKTEEARACRQYFEKARKATLRAFSWPFANRIVSLGLIEECPNIEWGFSYRYPPDCLQLLKIQSGIRNDTRQSRVPYKLSSDEGGKLILTDHSDAIVEYTKNITDFGIQPDDFELALSFKLAFYIAPRLTKGDPFKIKKDMFDGFQFELAEAKASAKNEEQVEELPQSEFIRQRE